MKQGSNAISSSPGSITQQIASKSAPEVPAVTRTWRSPWRNSPSTEAWIFSRSSGIPCVTVYAFRPDSMARIAAFLTGSETSKSGRPIERLIGSFIVLAMSNALRIPETSICFIRSAIQASFTGGSAFHE